ncbi:MAG: D-alanyl-D-alanine carboxypeptidase [Candidatus Curtissbacteria bacterium]|nr:D-alanyl-D-alanine carboxypeptidase [Candidatus Curtissbacteria bacterium]
MKYVRFLIIALIFASLLLVITKPNVETRVKKKTQPLQTEDLPKLFPYPLPVENPQPSPQISAQSAVIIDAKSGVVLFEKNPHLRLLPASTAKLMTALVALEKCSPDDVVTVTYIEQSPNSMGLSQGDKVTIKSLLYGMLVVSGNDAAYALAYSCSNNIGEFVREMNQKALELGMNNTHYTNPAGFDDPAYFSTASDLAKLAKVSVSNPLIAKIVATKSTVVTDLTGNKTYFLQSTNELLEEVEGVIGVKTGQTEGSKEILLSQTARNGNTIITVILKSESRFVESKALIEWAFKNHYWVNP